MPQVALPLSISRAHSRYGSLQEYLVMKSVKPISKGEQIL